MFECDRAVSARTYGYGPNEFFGFFEGLGYRLCDLFGRPFARPDWDTPGFPYYFIAFADGAADHDRVEAEVPGLLRRALAAAPA